MTSKTAVLLMKAHQVMLIFLVLITNIALPEVTALLFANLHFVTKMDVHLSASIAPPRRLVNVDCLMMIVFMSYKYSKDIEKRGCDKMKNESVIITTSVLSIIKFLTFLKVLPLITSRPLRTRFFELR